MEERALIDLLDRFSAAATPEEVWRVSGTVFGDFGSDWVTFGTRRPQSLPAIRTTVAPELMADYMAVGLYQGDAWLHYCARSTQADDLVVGSACPGDPGYPVQEVFEAHGVRRAVLFPCSHATEAAGMVVYARTSESTEWLTSSVGRSRLRLIVALVSSRYRPACSDNDAPGFYGDAVRLSPREADVLCWLSQGLDTETIALRMKLAPVTVTKHLAAARRRLGARTREQALAIALTRGLLRI
jgi:DNA-binding CsgD family transcriptional regulator